MLDYAVRFHSNMAINIVGLKRNGSLVYILIRNLALPPLSPHNALVLHFKNPLSLTEFGRMLLN